MQNILNHISDRLSHPTGCRKKIKKFSAILLTDQLISHAAFIFVFSVCGSYYTALSYNIIVTSHFAY